MHEPRLVQSSAARTRDRSAHDMQRGNRPTAAGRRLPRAKHGWCGRGDIKKLLVLELLPKQVNFSGGPDLVSWLGTFSLERVLGTVPVEEDGSAYFEVPAGRPVFFVALDENDRSVKRMHSFVSVMPGETTSCVGCHEPRTTSPLQQQLGTLAALARQPSKIEPFDGLPDVLDFPRDIQPILDQHCVECHNYQRREGGVLLTGDLGRNGLTPSSICSLICRWPMVETDWGTIAPRSIGSAASPLLRQAGPEPLRRESDAGPVAHGLDVDRERCTVCRQLCRTAQCRGPGIDWADAACGGRSENATDLPAAMWQVPCGGQEPPAKRAERFPFNPNSAEQQTRRRASHRHPRTGRASRTIRSPSTAAISW